MKTYGLIGFMWAHFKLDWKDGLFLVVLALVCDIIEDFKSARAGEYSI